MQYLYHFRKLSSMIFERCDITWIIQIDALFIAACYGHQCPTYQRMHSSSYKEVLFLLLFFCFTWHESLKSHSEELQLYTLF